MNSVDLHWVWLVIAAGTALPVAYVSFLLNPLVYFWLGRERWEEQLVRVWPLRWRLGFDVAICAFAIAMFVVSG